MAKIDDLEFRITATTDALRTDLARGSAQVQQFANKTATTFETMNRQIGRTFSSVRSLLGLFGVSVGVRAFSSWIKGALDAKNMTEQQLKATEQARAALESMRKASDELARSLANSLTPAMQGVANVLTGWNRLLTGADPNPFEHQINAAAVALDDLRRKLENMEKFGGYRFVDRDQLVADIAAAEAALTSLKRKQEQSLGVGLGGLIPKDAELKEMVAGLGKPLDLPIALQIKSISADAIQNTLLGDGLSEMVAGNGKPLELPVGLQLQQIDPNAVAKLFEPVKKESKFTAEFIGMQFEDAFTGWILGAERSFSDLLKRMAVEMATSAIFKGFASLFPGGSFFANFFGGARAEGGPVSAGRGYLVGERGPELFVPGRSGMIAAGGGGSVVINQYNTFSGGSGGREERAAMSQELARNNQRLKAEISHEIRRGRI